METQFLCPHQQPRHDRNIFSTFREALAEMLDLVVADNNNLSIGSALFSLVLIDSKGPQLPIIEDQLDSSEQMIRRVLRCALQLCMVPSVDGSITFVIGPLIKARACTASHNGNWQ